MWFFHGVIPTVLGDFLINFLTLNVDNKTIFLLGRDSITRTKIYSFKPISSIDQDQDA